MARAFFRTCREYSRNMGVQAWREGVMPVSPSPTPPVPHTCPNFVWVFSSFHPDSHVS